MEHTAAQLQGYSNSMKGDVEIAKLIRTIYVYHHGLGEGYEWEKICQPIVGPSGIEQGET